MKRSQFAIMLSTFILLLAPAVASAAGVGDVTIRISNNAGEKYDNKVVIGQTNTLEVWISNDDLILGASWGFELEFTCDRSWVRDADRKDKRPWVEEHNRAKDSFNMPGLLMLFSLGHGNVDSLLLGGGAMDAGMPEGKSKLAYTLAFNIPADAKPSESGLCVRPIFYPPAGTWTATDSDGGYAPTFNGQPTMGQAAPRTKAMCFDIVAVE